MLLRGLTWLVAFQLLGTVLNVLFLPMLPGPIIGMVLLFAGLLLPPAIEGVDMVDVGIKSGIGAAVDIHTAA